MSRLPITRRAVVAGLPLVLAGGKAAADEAKTISFLAIGDWGRDGASHQQRVADQMALAAETDASRFVVALGDNFYPHGVQSANDARWQTSFEAIYKAPSLQSPWVGVLGNHDYQGVVQAQIDYAAKGGRWRMPSRFYKVSGATFGAPQLDLFILDTTPLVDHVSKARPGSPRAANLTGQDRREQLSWLNRALGQSLAPVKLVLGHHTIYSGSLVHGSNPELIASVVPILRRHGVRAYINGHDHDLQHIRTDGVDYICSGAGSEVRPTGQLDNTLFALSRSGFALFRLRGTALELEFRDFRGKTVYQAQVGT